MDLPLPYSTDSDSDLYTTYFKGLFFSLGDRFTECSTGLHERAFHHPVQPRVGKSAARIA